MADFIVDMGKEGGRKGGEIIFAGPPEKLAILQGSYTGEYLREELKL